MLHDQILLLAVTKHGFGRWLDIAQDPTFGLYTMLMEMAAGQTAAGQPPCNQLSSRPCCRCCQASVMIVDTHITVALRLLWGAPNEAFLKVRSQRKQEKHEHAR